MPNVQQLRDITRIRQIQRTAAQQTAHARTEELQSAQKNQEQAQAALNAMETSWREALARPRLDLALLPAWTQGVCQDRAALAEHDRIVAQKKDGRAQAVDNWRASLAREEVAQSLWRDEQRANANRLEERQLSIMEDRAPRAGPSL